MAIPHDILLKTETIQLSSGNDGYWLYDYTRGMNVAMRAKDERSAFVEALKYYQNRLIQVETELKTLDNKVNAFVSQFIDESGDNY